MLSGTTGMMGVAGVSCNDFARSASVESVFTSPTGAVSAIGD